MDSGHWPAGLARRGLAFLVDMLVIVILLGVGQALAHLLGRWDVVARAFRAAFVAVVPAAYVVLAHGSSGRTAGKWLAGIRVVGRDSQPIGYRRALARLVFLPLSILPFGIGLLVAVFSRDRRTLHDHLAGTRVVRSRLLS